jgi:acetolactate synthase-1/2/3 large subunit
VVISLPEDMLKDEVDVKEPADPSEARPDVAPDAAPTTQALADLQQLLADSERPVVIAGGSGWDAGAVDDLVELAEQQQLPVAVSFRRQMLFPASHPHFIGDLGVGANPSLVAYIREADLVLLIGGRLSDVPSQHYTLLKIPTPDQTFIHVHPGAEEIGRLYRPDLAFVLSPRHFLRATRDLAPAARGREHHLAVGRQLFASWTGLPAKVPGEFNLAEAIRSLHEVVPEDTIVCNGAGNYASWVHRFYRYERFGTQLAPTSGSMGYGVPAAVAAKRIYPEKTVIAFAGDGCFLMNGQEFATAVQYELPIAVIVVDNGMYGTIRMHQEREYPGRVVATQLRNPDFVGYAHCFGGYGERVERTRDFAPALARAIASGKPAILHCMMDPQAITPSITLDEIRTSQSSHCVNY